MAWLLAPCSYHTSRVSTAWSDILSLTSLPPRSTLGVPFDVVVVAPSSPRAGALLRPRRGREWAPAREGASEERGDVGGIPPARPARRRSGACGPAGRGDRALAPGGGPPARGPARAIAARREMAPSRRAVRDRRAPSGRRLGRARDRPTGRAPRTQRRRPCRTRRAPIAPRGSPPTVWRSTGHADRRPPDRTVHARARASEPASAQSCECRAARPPVAAAPRRPIALARVRRVRRAAPERFDRRARAARACQPTTRGSRAPAGAPPRRGPPDRGRPVPR